MPRDLKCVYISSEIHTLLKHLSIELGATMKDLVEEFIREGILMDARHDPAIRQMLRYFPQPGPSANLRTGPAPTLHSEEEG